MERSDALALLQAECTTSDELELLLELLARFKFISSEDLNAGFNAMVDQIVNGWQLESMKTAICPPKVDSSSDSGPAVVQFLKTILGKRSIRGYELTIRVNKIRDTADSRPNIVITDDFSGTGKTILNKLKIISDIYGNRPHKKYVCLLAASSVARQNIEPQVDGYYVWQEFNKGISDYYHGSDLETAISAMKSMESRLKAQISGIDLPCFGYGQTEVLMGWDENLPNSVFPIFWWPETATGSQRETLFSRFF